MPKPFLEEFPSPFVIVERIDMAVKRIGIDGDRH